MVPVLGDVPTHAGCRLLHLVLLCLLLGIALANQVVGWLLLCDLRWKDNLVVQHGMMCTGPRESTFEIGQYARRLDQLYANTIGLLKLPNLSTRTGDRSGSLFASRTHRAFPARHDNARTALRLTATPFQR